MQSGNHIKQKVLTASTKYESDIVTKNILKLENRKSVVHVHEICRKCMHHNNSKIKSPVITNRTKYDNSCQ